MTSMPQAVAELVERFSHNFNAYHRSDYNETQVRVQFIDPLFEALGWDVLNRRGVAPRYQDVVHEAALHDRGGTKAPDYSFRIGSERKFFVEAKKPAVDIRGDTHPAYQLRRYGWTAKLCLSVLTDFEEFSVYDCRYQPKRTDKAGQHRILYVPYQEYGDRWDEIASVFSKEAVWRGDFDAYCQSVKAKRGTQEVDEAFLKEIEGWREMLARNIALRNPDLTVRDLNYAVQQTLDRIIFLRICEDRGIEPYEQLRGTVNGGDAYGRLLALFHRADDRYDSGLFHFRAEKGRQDRVDTLTPSLQIDDKVLRSLIDDLYYPQSPYEFSVLSADILGNVYEQFLGSTIRLTPAHRAKIEQKPEVRKAGGVYYTPKYIVDYIVEHTVGKLCEGKTPGQISRLRILDPACGSGSFLLGAYGYLLDYHLNWYVEHPTRQARKEIYQGRGGEWFLTTEEKKRILLNNIYGVDIDPQAVEVTKLSLLLKVLEDENETQMRLWQERALPDLGDNVKCGNSLIGTDFCEQASFLDEEEMYRVNPFDWDKEFPEIMGDGGFDAVIGNPPYIRMEGFKGEKPYLREHYGVHSERLDLYGYFIERELGLLRDHGRFGMIVSNKFLKAKYGHPVRKYLLEHSQLETVFDLAGLKVFPGATVRTVIVIAHRERSGNTISFQYVPVMSTRSFDQVTTQLQTLDDVALELGYVVGSDQVSPDMWNLTHPRTATLLSSIVGKGIPLPQYLAPLPVCRGIVSGLTEAFVIESSTRHEIIGRNPDAEEIIKPLLNGRGVRRYDIQWKGKYLIYTYHGIDIEKYPAVEEHLEPFRSKLVNRATKQAWYELQQPQQNYRAFMEAPKIVFPDIATTTRFALDSTGYYGTNTTYFLPRADLYLLGLLNSKVAHFYFSETCAALEGANDSYLRFFGQYMENMPVATCSSTQNNQMVELVERMLALHKDLDAAKTPGQRTVIQRQIAATDRQIDELVYELYELTDDEIKIVEAA